MKPTTKYLTSLTLLASFLSGCIENTYDFSSVSVDLNLTPAIAAPIAEGELSILPFFNDDTTANPIVKADASNLLHIYYHQVLDTLTYDDFAGKAQDQHQTVKMIPEKTTLPTNVNMAGTITILFPLALVSPDQDIKQVVLEKGTFRLSYNSSFELSSDAVMEVTSDDIILQNGSSYRETLTSKQNAVTADFRNTSINPSLKNTVTFKIKYSFAKVAMCKGFDALNLNFDLTNTSSLSTTGYLGKITTDLSNRQFAINYGKKIFNSEDASIKSPKVTLEFANGINVPFRYTNQSISAVVKSTPIAISGFPEITQITAADNLEKATSTSSYASFDYSTNLITALSKFPEYLVFDGKITSNYDGIERVNRVKKGDAVTIKAAMDLPLEVMLKNVVLRDTISYDLSVIAKNLDKIEAFKLLFTTSNGYPSNFQINAYLANDKKTAIDTLFAKPYEVKSAAVQNGEVSENVISAAEAEFSNSRLRIAANTRYIIIVATGTTSGAENGSLVKIKGNNSLKVKVTGATKLNIKE